MLWTLLWLLVALLVGGTLALQAGVNVQLRAHVGHPILAAVGSFVVGTLALTLYALVLRLPWPSVAMLRQSSWWQWSGGVLGGVYLIALVALTPRLGVATFLACAVAGQMLVALLLDHYGLLGFPVHSISAVRLLGALCLLVGVVLIRIF